MIQKTYVKSWQAKIEEAQRLGKTVFVESYMTSYCHDKDEQCSRDIVKVFAHPDGTITKDIQHTW